MNEKSRIRFNPHTKEVEIEGSEAFVKTFFQKIQELMSGPPAAVKAVKKPTATLSKKKAARNKKYPKATAMPVKGGLREKSDTQGQSTSLFDKVVGLIRDSRGITTGELQDKTGLTKKQIWSITYRAEKIGVIKRAKKGVYEAAG